MIPTTIHQIWLGEGDEPHTAPPLLAEASESWSRVNPGWEHRIWSGGEVEALFATSRPDLLELYRSYAHWVQRADAGRYLVLQQHGGVYADFDVACARPIAGLTHEELVLCPTWPYGMSNDLMMARPDHPLFRAVLDGLPAASRRWNRPWVLPYLRVMFGTGSSHLTHTFMRMERPGPVRLLTPEEYGQRGSDEAFVRHLKGNAWHAWDGRILAYVASRIERLHATARRRP